MHNLHCRTKKEIDRTVSRRRDAMKLFVALSKILNTDNVGKMIRWCHRMPHELDLAQRKARRFQAELLLAIRGLGEPV